MNVHDAMKLLQILWEGACRTVIESPLGPRCAIFVENKCSLRRESGAEQRSISFHVENVDRLA